MKRTLILLWVALATSPLPAASAAPESSPEAVVEKALDALYHDRIPGFIQALHPDALKEYRASVLELLELVVKKGHPKALTEGFQGVATAEDLKKLDAPAMLTAMFTRLTSELRVKVSWSATQVKALGSIPDGKEGAYVVCRSRTTHGNVMFQRFSVVLARKIGDEWKLMLPEEFTSELTLMKQSVADDAKPPDFAATKFEPLGHVMDGPDAAMVVYRMETPMGAAALTRLDVLRIGPEAPEWNAVLKDEKDAVRELLKRKVQPTEAPQAK